jgi:hypothetical protein
MKLMLGRKVKYRISSLFFFFSEVVLEALKVVKQNRKKKARVPREVKVWILIFSILIVMEQVEESTNKAKKWPVSLDKTQIVC